MNSLTQSLFTALQACHAALQNLHVRQHWDKHIEDLLGDDMYAEAVDAENLAAAALADARLRTEPSSDTGLFSGVIPSDAKDTTPAQQAALNVMLPEDLDDTLVNELINVIWPYLDDAHMRDAGSVAEAEGLVRDAVENALDTWDPAPPEDDRTPSSVGPDAPAAGERRQDGQHEFADCGGHPCCVTCGSDEDDAFVGGQECTFGVDADAPDDAVNRMMAEDIWGEHPDFPRADWRAARGDGDTQSGYWDWTRSQIEQRADEEGSK